MSSSVSRQPSTWAWTAETNMAQARTSRVRLTIGNGFFMSASLTVDQILLPQQPGQASLDTLVERGCDGGPTGGGSIPVIRQAVASHALLRVHPAGLAVPIDDNEAREQLACGVTLDARRGQVSLVHGASLLGRGQHQGSQFPVADLDDLDPVGLGQGLQFLDEAGQRLGPVDGT